MREEEKIFAGQLFSPGHSDLVAIKTRSHKLSAAYGQIDEGDKEARTALAKIMLAEYGEGSSMTGPVFFHYGKHTCIGKRVFINYNFTVQDDAPVVIGDDCNFGPNCTIVTPIHPMLPQERLEMYDENGEKKHMCYA